uniref:Retrotransposon Copia-like N-terminal domain-containing protein n=1 Tax=Cannabis sativa TaxID=3483 RepID=A0A803PJX9_CANSA
MLSSTSDPAPTTMANASSSVAPANHTWNPFPNSLTSSLTLKLDRLNFLSWKSQVVPAVIGQDLDEILFTKVHPPQNLVTGTPNPELCFCLMRVGWNITMTDLVVKMQANLVFGNGRSGGVRPFATSKNPQFDLPQSSSGRGKGYP